MMKRRDFCAVTAAGFLSIAGGDSMFAALSPPDTLRAHASAKGLLYGAALHSDRLKSDAAYGDFFAQQCAILTPEAELKWRALRPTKDRFSFDAADCLFTYAAAHRLKVRGHTFVWHGSMPTWFDSTVTPQNARDFLQTHISTVGDRYAGRVHSWDVVNEGIDPKDGRSDGLRDTPWLRLLGDDYIGLAFQMARDADPKALLVYNDYGLDYNQPDQEERRQATLALLKRLLAAGAPVQALGLQAHLYGDDTKLDAGVLQRFLASVSDLGLKILVTEMDVRDTKLGGPIPQRDTTVADLYGRYLGAVLQNPHVIVVQTWGLSDRYTWLTQHAPRQDRLPMRPLPFDDQFKSKLASAAIADAFDAAPVRAT